VNAKSTIKKVLFISFWVCVAGGMLTLLVAAINKKNKGECQGYSITIKGAESNLFIDKNDILKLLQKETNGNIKGSPVASFHLHLLEEKLEKNTWVEKAELYFDNNDVLHISIHEKEPVARIFTTGDASFYIDSLGSRMPLSDKLSARVPVFTGFPNKKNLSSRDSALLNDVTKVANFIIKDPFWMAQIAQIDINENGAMEMIPVVGNHIVRIGNGESIEKKFHRLMIFYKQIVSKTGFDKFKLIDVQFDGQVVASRYGTNKNDTALLRKNVETLLKQSIESQSDTVMQRSSTGLGRYQIDGDSANVQEAAVTKPVSAKLIEKRVDSRALLPKPVEKKINNVRQPKAVMPVINHNQK
jgi:cell division protein FtsQ